MWLTSFTFDIDSLQRIVLALSHPVPLKVQFQFTSFHNHMTKTTQPQKIILSEKAEDLIQALERTEA